MFRSLREIFDLRQTFREMRELVEVTGLLGVLVMTVCTVSGGIAVLATIGLAGVALSALVNAAFVPQLAAIALPAAFAIVGGFGISFASFFGVTRIFHTERAAKRTILRDLKNMPEIGKFIRNGDIDPEPYIQLGWKEWQQNPDWKRGPPSLAEVAKFIARELLHPSDAKSGFSPSGPRRPKDAKQRRSHDDDPPIA